MRNRDAAVKLDVTGAVLVTASLAAVIYGVVNTTDWGWTLALDPLVAPRRRGRTGRLPLLGGAASPRIRWCPSASSARARSRSANVVMLLVGGAFFAMWYFLTFYFQNILGLRRGASRASPSCRWPSAIIAGAQISSRLLVKHRRAAAAARRRVVRHARASCGSRSSQVDSSYWGNVLVPSIVCSFAMGLLFAPLATAATTGVDRADAGPGVGPAQHLAPGRRVARRSPILGTVAADRTRHLRRQPGLAGVAGRPGTSGPSRSRRCITLVALRRRASLVPRHTGRAANDPRRRLRT